MPKPSAAKILYGGDYNPEQWPEDVRKEDLALFDKAGIDTLTIGVFSWGLFQRNETEYDFGELDSIVESLQSAGKRICLATGTGGHPAWLARKYPDVTRVDFEGRKHVYGQRHNACPNSPSFRRFATAYVEQLATRYRDVDEIVAWHIGNEYGGACYCENCARAFRVWLQRRYGTLQRLNEAWNTTFWSHTMYDWDDVVPPNALSEHWRGPDHTAFNGITLDYHRFTTDSMIDSFLAEKEVVRRHTPSIPVTTNFMGQYRPLDYHRWAPHLDFASWDNYPRDAKSPDMMGLSHDLMRGLKRGDPFWLMEQTPSTTASRDVNPVKRPGILALWSWQAVAHGADAVLYFQMRQSKGACEKYHGAVIDHSGRDDTRVFRETADLGSKLEHLAGEIVGSQARNRTALLFDWDSWWALEISDGPNRLLKYQDVMRRYYAALQNAGIGVDVVDVSTDLSGYDVVVAPVLHLLKGDLAGRIERFVDGGGHFVTTFLSGRVDVDDNAFLSDVPGPLVNVLGLRVTETDALGPEEPNSITVTDAAAGPFEASLIFDVVETGTAEVLATYANDFYAGTPAVTRNRLGQGTAWYCATHLDSTGVTWLLGQVLAEAGLSSPYGGVPGIEVTERHRDDATYLFLLNHGITETVITLDRTGRSLLTDTDIAAGDIVAIPAAGVVVLKSAPTAS
ncbi:beta-galactosidase [Kineococcus rhizosphaerae]|uniref:Beta-galactosidase n=1 Tax=Kineococcus rhizosphaerae TaxID=559628 RepID=A0A2T0QRC3_9ACTN|nr:beta-galactosidase [Kineococcus rhizosphaerae]PRY07330.1 beta-galactosidase [Kineococcus rhizosphaerae]